MPAAQNLAHRAGATGRQRAHIDRVRRRLGGLDARDLNGDRRIAVHEVVAADDAFLAGEFGPGGAKAGAPGLVVFKQIVLQHVGGLESLLLERPFGHDDAFNLRRAIGGEGLPADALHPHLRIGCARGERDDAFLLGGERCRPAQIVIRRGHDKVHAFRRELGADLGAQRRVGFHVALDRLDLPPKQAVFFVELLDRQQRRVRAGNIVRRHKSALRAREADLDRRFVLRVGCAQPQDHQADRRRDNTRLSLRAHLQPPN